MFILLEPGMEIKVGDTAYDDPNWEPIDIFFTGTKYQKDHVPMRREIETIAELFASYNKE